MRPLASLLAALVAGAGAPAEPALAARAVAPPAAAEPPGAAPAGRGRGEGCGEPVAWPHWEAYAARFVTRDGRVVDFDAGEATTSEGQAYALFHALVANDRARFERVLGWTRQHLAGGDLGRRLPAWKWGKAKGRWGVLDRNSAADADLWLGYALLEAGRLWSEPRLAAEGRRVLELVARVEVAALPGLGPALLPGPVGFELERGKAWRLNPSYLPPSLLRGLDAAGVPGPWGALLDGAARLVGEAAPRGLVPDWAVWRAEGGLEVDPATGPVGSFDAIRVYLWAGLLHPEDPRRMAFLDATAGLPRWWTEHGGVPAQVDVRTGEPRGAFAPPGFAAALLPRAVSTGDRELASSLQAALAASLSGGLFGAPPTYYDQNLALFGLGFAEGRFSFSLDGRLVTAWRDQCDVP